MEKATNHLLSLINDVLQMSKLEDGREELSSELVCLPDVFYDMKAIMDGSALDKGISVDFSEDSIWESFLQVRNFISGEKIYFISLLAYLADKGDS